MVLANPPIDLTGHCTAVYNNTLYVYSPAGFQSIDLKVNAKWNVLPMGVSVTGGVCVGDGGPGNGSTSGLWIVGGQANSSMASYPGMQRFSYATNKWDTISPAATVTQNRRNHGATYINQTASVLVYAGSQDNDNALPSSQTFLISTIPPYNVLSFSSAAPPLFSPMIMPWDNSRAVMVGGDPTNQNIFLFDSDSGWQDLGTTLVEAVHDPKTMQCSLVTGDDGSKVLEKYNMGVNPNTVTRYVLWTGTGPAPPGAIVGAPATKNPTGGAKRDLTSTNWPVYNGTLAPTVTRSDYAIAQAPNGYAIITGGAPNDPLAIFDQRGNSWVSVSSVFGSKAQVPLGSSPTNSSTVAGPTHSASATPLPSDVGSKSKSLAVLGGVLGGVLGLAALLILILMLLKCSAERETTVIKKRRERSEKEDRLSFADQGTEFMHEAGGSVGRGYSESMNGSVTSLALFSGKTMHSHRRGLPSDASTVGLVKNKSPLGITDTMEMSHIQDRSPSNPSPEHAVQSSPQTSHAESSHHSDQTRSTGWSQYFANNDVTDLSSLPPGARGTYQTNASDISKSDYPDSRLPSTHSGNMPPLELNMGPSFDKNRISSTTASSGPLENRSHAISTSSYGDALPRSHFSVASNEQQRDSSASNMTTFPRGLPSPAIGGNAFARPYPYTAPKTSPGANNPKSYDFPMPNAYVPGQDNRDSAMSNVTVFPRGIPSDIPSPALKSAFAKPRLVETKGPDIPAATVAATSRLSATHRGPTIRKMTGDEDMSWLNINAGRAL